MIIGNVTIFRKNSMYIEVLGLTEELNDTFVNDATVTVSLKDENGNIVSGVSGTQLTYVPASNGDYRGVIGGSTFKPVAGADYYLEVTASAGPGADGHWILQANVIDRSS